MKRVITTVARLHSFASMSGNETTLCVVRVIAPSACQHEGLNFWTCGHGYTRLYVLSICAHVPFVSVSVSGFRFCNFREVHLPLLVSFLACSFVHCGNILFHAFIQLLLHNIINLHVIPCVNC